MVKNLPAVKETQVQSLGQEDPLGRKGQPTPVFLPEKVKVAQLCLTLCNPHGLSSHWNSPRLGLNSWLGTIKQQQANAHRWKSADFRAYVIS